VQYKILLNAVHSKVAEVSVDRTEPILDSNGEIVKQRSHHILPKHYNQVITGSNPGEAVVKDAKQVHELVFNLVYRKENEQFRYRNSPKPWEKLTDAKVEVV